MSRLLPSFAAALIAVALAACAKPAAPVPQASDTPGTLETALLPVMGPERRILAVGGSLVAGHGLASPADSYPARLETALRARGIDARIAVAGLPRGDPGGAAPRLAAMLAGLPHRPDLVILETAGENANISEQGVPVLSVNLLAPLAGKPDLLQEDAPLPNARGVDEIVAATVGQVANALPRSAPPHRR